MKNTIIILLFTLLLFNCSNDDNTTSNTVNVASVLIAEGSLFGAGEEGINQQQVAITDSNTWNALLAQMDSSITDEFTETDIDFSNFQVILVVDEVKPNGGYSFELDITKNTNNIIVDVTNVTPQGNATTVITQPFHIVKIPASSLPVVFQ